MMLSPEDSKRVADALIAKIESADVDIAYAVAQVVRDLVLPTGEPHWKRDWFPLSVEELSNEIAAAVQFGITDGLRK
jgi:glutamine synthetase type III